MSLLGPAVLTAALAAYLLIPHAAAPIGRLRERRGTTALSRREPGMPLRQRLFGGLAASIAVLVLVPGDPGLLGALLLGPAIVVLLGLLRRRPDTVRAATALPQTLEFLSVCLEVGLPLPRAIEVVSRVSEPPTSDMLEGISANVRLGRNAADVWREVSADPVWGRVAGDIARSEQSGTALADLLRIHAEDARVEVHEAALKAARKVGVKSVVPLMACFLPAFLMVGVVPIIAGLLGDFFG